MTEPKADAKDMVGEAERLVQQTSAQAAVFIARTLARVREEAEDIWAEAKSISTSRR